MVHTATPRNTSSIEPRFVSSIVGPLLCRTVCLTKRRAPLLQASRHLLLSDGLNKMGCEAKRARMLQYHHDSAMTFTSIPENHTPPGGVDRMMIDETTFVDRCALIGSKCIIMVPCEFERGLDMTQPAASQRRSVQ
jgi:hypothetical protein